MEKLRADQVWGMPVTRLPRIFCLPLYSLNTKSLRYRETVFFPLLCMGEKLGASF
jgi:hypothetical protein